MRSESAPAGHPPTLPAHVAVEVSGNVVRAGSARRRFREGDARSLLIAYLSLVRGLRDQRRARTIELRRADIEALARHLGRPGSEVVAQLAEVMGATRSQRATMLTLFGSGALVIGLAGSTAAGRAEPAPTNVFDPGPAIQAVAPQPDPVVLPAASAASTTTVPSTSITEPPATNAVAAPAPVEEPPTIVDPPAPAPAPRSEPDPPLRADPIETAAPPAAPEPEPAPESTAPTPDSGIDGIPPGDTTPDDTIVTDIGTPPVPPTTVPSDTTPDDTVVTDIGTPPVPPTTVPSDTTPDDTVVTDICTPPVPPTTVPSDTTPDDTVVTDICTPPIPPVADTVAG